jgi:4-hydroxy-2-oxoheptanedioate aldolase
LNEGKPTLGTHVLSTWPTVYEIVGQTGHWDYVEFVAEYAPWTTHDLDNIARAIELFPSLSGMIKVEQDMRGHLAMRAIGSGLQNVLFAGVRTADDARACVHAVRPAHPDYGGMHGVGLRRDARTVLHYGSPEWVQALADSVIVLMIERFEAVENLEAILSIEGIDMIQFGPADYAMSIGLPGQNSHERVREAERHVVETAHSHGVPARAEMFHPRDAGRYVDLGIRHFCVGVDVRILHDYFTEQGAEMRELLDSMTTDAAIPVGAATQGDSGDPRK